MRLLALFALVGCQSTADDPAALPADQLGPPTYTIDSNNAANDTSRYYIQVSGNWTSSTNVAGYYNTGYFVAPSLWQYDPANFWFYLDADQCMHVESWWTSAADRAPNVPYQSYNAAGGNLGVTYVNQRSNGGRWNSVGKYIFTTGWNRVLISRWADLGYYVVADAMRVTPASDCPGWCGADADGDGVAACQDQCETDRNKTTPGVCGCGVADTNSDGDAWADCQETCDTDPGKSAPGVCGCGVSDANSDGDALLDCQESCDTDPAKTAPGVCGCGLPDNDADGDGLLACQESCPSDPAKTSPGVCGCGVADTNTDGDAQPDCQETCDADPAKTAPGVCGCGVADTDSDGDGAADCVETCDLDPDKTEPGTCGCGTADEDITGDGVADCTTCGDGAVQAPELCDDGDRVNGDGCDEVCQWEDLQLSISPGNAGVVNTLLATSARPGQRVVFLAAYRLGSTPVPGCPGLRVALDSPMNLGIDLADGAGEATFAVNIPAALAGRTFALVAVEPSSCRATDVLFETF